jgi:hypothetical protein
VAQRLAAARGVSLDDLAGVSSDRIQIDGHLVGRWEAFNEGRG